MSDPITREETYLAALSGESVNLPEPITREEMYLAAAAGMAVELPNPITRKEQFLMRVVENGSTGGGGVTIRNQDKTITQNGQYKADSGYTGLGTVTVAVPQEEPVVEPLEVTENGTYNPPEGVDGYGPVTVNVAASSGGDDLARAIVEGTLTEYTDSETTTVRANIFNGITSLQMVDIPNATSVGASAFQGCSNLLSVNLPNATSIPNAVCQNCKNLERVNFKNAQIAGYNAFSMSQIKVIDLHKMRSLQNSTFAYCASLKIVALRSDTVCTINTTLMTSVPYISFLVPSGKVEEYKTTATNWSASYANGQCDFLALESYTVDGTITGELDENKIAPLLA